ncbi:MAG TPA: OmpA family protein [Vicinamibacterales bacterium]|nr:OmpA family protein [Vicinamibacterales bacterium]
MSAKIWLIVGMVAVLATPAAAQQTTTQNDDQRGRVAITTDGDAGLWWLPVADTNGKKKHRGSVQRNSFNTPQGQMNVANFTANVSYGLADRVDVFAAWDVIQRVDRDNQQLFNSDPERGGVDPRVPFANERWSGNKMGDLRVGAKFGLLSEAAGNPFGLAARGYVNLPTGDNDEGGSQGGVSADVSGVISKWVNRHFVLTGEVGYNFRKNPEDPVVAHVPNFLRWGAGIGITPNDHWLIHGEMLGRTWQRDTTTLDGVIIAEDGTISPTVSVTERTTSFTTGITWFATNGFFIGGELRFDTPRPARINASEDSNGDFVDYHVRIGWSPRRFVPPPVAPTPPPPVAPPAPVHELSVKAACDPCTVEVGKTSTVTATPTSSISCVVTYNWSAPTGTFADRTQQKTIWTAPMQEGPVPVTVTVTCPQDGKTASDTVTIQVIRPAAKVYTFEDVHFDFDRYTLRPEALRVLEQAVSAMKEDPSLRLTLEGHTCSIGTAEYNLALGERRSTAVRDYLTQNGVAATRLQTVSFGEEKPKHDNSREETRRLNRRAALVVRLDK